MSYIMVDVESDGPIPGDYSMVCFGAVSVKDPSKTFYGQTMPISDLYIPDALAVSGFTREQHEGFDDPKCVMEKFALWIKEVSEDRPVFISDNNGYDYMFIHWYFHHFTGNDPFGHSSQNLGSLYKGLVRNMRHNFKHLRKTRHSHNPVDDCMGNVEAFKTLIEKYHL